MIIIICHHEIGEVEIFKPIPTVCSFLFIFVREEKFL